MKKTLLVLSALLLSQVAMAGEWPRYLHVYKGSTPDLDGIITKGEYNDATIITGVENWNDQFRPVINPEDLSLKCWIKHDGNDLYFAFDITDDILYGVETDRWVPDENPENVHDFTKASFPWFGDGIELLINASYTWPKEVGTFNYGDERSWQVVCNHSKSLLDGIGKGGLIQGEQRDNPAAWKNHEKWIRSGDMKAVTKIKPDKTGYIVEWRIGPKCLQVDKNKEIFWSPDIGTAKMGLNIGIQDLDNRNTAPDNWGRFHHEAWWAGEKYHRTEPRQWGTMYVHPEKKTKNLFVAPDGNDTAAGTKNAPLKSLKGAQIAVRKILSKNLNQDVTVFVKGGTYRLENTLLFTAADSPSRGKVIYTAVPGGKVIVSSGVPITGWKKVTTNEEPDGLTSPAKGKLYSADIPPAIGCIKTLYRNTEKLPRSQCRGFFPTEIEPWISNDKKLEKSSLNVMCFPKKAMRSWTNIEDIEIRIIPRYQFTMNILPLLSVDEKNLVATTKIDGTYQLIHGHFSDPSQSASVWVENAPEGLNKPDTWMVNTYERKIYYWPKHPSHLKGIVAPALKELIRFEGNENAKSYVKNIELRGFTFTHGERDTWDEITACVQHDYASYNRGDALVRFRFAQDCKIQYCHFTNSGGMGIRCDLFAQQIKIENNKFDNLGSSAVMFAGFGPGKKDLNKNNRVANNHIHDIGQEYWQSSAILIYQSGNNLIANNYIHDVPFNAIAIVGHRSPYFKPGKRSRETACMRFHEMNGIHTWPEIVQFLHGKNNVIEYNRITHVGKKCGDVNGIYVSSTGWNNHIRYNYLYDVQFRMYNAAIRSDDQQHDTYINHNVIDGCAGRGITLKGRNYVENNFVIDIPEPNDPRNPNEIPLQGYIVLKRGPMDGSTIKNNILYHPGKEPLLFWAGPAFNTVIKLSDAKTDMNLVYCAGDPSKSDEYLDWARSEQSSEKNSIAANPMFTDIKNHNYTLKSESPIFSLGIDQIDVSKTGLTGQVGPNGYTK